MSRSDDRNRSRLRVALPSEGFVTNLTGILAIQGLGFITALLAARLFNPADRGTLAAAVSWSLLLFAIGDLGLSEAVPFLAAKRRSGVGATAVVVAVLIALFLAPIFFIAIRFIGPDLSGTAMLYAIVGAPISLIITYAGALFQGESRLGVFNLYRIMGNIPYALGLVLAGGQATRTPDRVLLIALWSSGLVCLLGTFYARRAIKVFGSPSREILRTLVPFGLKTYPGNLAWNGNQRLPLLILGGAAGTAALGYYSVALSYAMVPLVIASAFALLAPGRIASREGQAAIKESRRLSFLGIVATWLVALALIPLAGVIVPWVFGSAYTPSATSAAVLAGAFGLIGTNFILSASLRALGRPAAPSWAEMAGLIVTLVAAPIFAAKYGAVGSAWVAFASAFLATPILIAFARRHHRHPAEPKVTISVLTPAYNAAEYIEELISSVEGQTYPHVELIVIDDGSSDNTFTLLSQHQGLRAIRQENIGQYATQNKLLEMATGEVVLILGADDYLANPDSLLRVAEVFAQDPSVDVVVGRTARKMERVQPYLVRPDVPLWLGVRTVHTCLAIQHSSILVKKALLDEHGIRFDSTFRMRGDWDWLSRVFAKAHRVRTINMDVGVWRQHSNQTSRVAREQGKIETARVLEQNHVSPLAHALLTRLFDSYARAANAFAIIGHHGVVSLLSTAKRRRKESKRQ